MAFVNLKNYTLTSNTEAHWFMAMRDYVCKRASGVYDFSGSGIGWTLHDSSYNVDEDNVEINDYIVLKTVGEEGVDEMYLQITLINDYVKIKGWQYWNNSTHAGSGVSWWWDNAIEIGADPETIWVYGDLDFVHVIAQGVDGNTNWYNGSFGILDTSWLRPLEDLSTPVNRNVQVCSGSLSSGSDVSIVVPDSSSRLWAAGLSLMIMDDTNMEMFTVKTNNGSTTMTADLTNSYSANSRISVMFPYIVPGASTTHFAKTGTTVCIHNLTGQLGGVNTRPLTTTYILWPSYTYQDPGWNNAYLIAPYVAYEPTETGGFMGYFPHCGWTSGTGLSNYDILDDVIDVGAKWRYVNTTNIRVYREV